jgi:hypothetical protein
MEAHRTPVRPQVITERRHLSWIAGKTVKQKAGGLLNAVHGGQIYRNEPEKSTYLTSEEGILGSSSVASNPINFGTISKKSLTFTS